MSFLTRIIFVETLMISARHRELKYMNININGEKYKYVPNRSFTSYNNEKKQELYQILDQLCEQKNIAENRMKLYKNLKN